MAKVLPGARYVVAKRPGTRLRRQLRIVAVQPGGGSQQLADLDPPDSRGSCRHHGIDGLAFATSPRQCGALEQVFLDGSFLAFCWLVALESFRQFVGVIQDLLDRS